MINIPASMLLALPQGAGKTPGITLPWPNGSILSAQVQKQPDSAATTLLVGNYRLQTKIDGLPQQGNVWIQLMNKHANPPQLRMLSEARATAILAEQLAEAAGNEKRTSGQPQPRQQQDWPMPKQNQQGFHFHPSSNGSSLMLEEHEGGTPRGMVQKDMKEDLAALHGRLDLEHLGIIFFAVEKSGDAPFQLKVRASDRSAYVALHEPFNRWLEENSERTAAQGELSQGDEPIIKPERPVRTTI